MFVKAQNNCKIDLLKSKEKTDYMMFMLHTSEMMPGGSPAFRSEASIEKLYDDLEVFFKYVSSFCVGKTIGEYALGYR